jgi:hypothetical protein
MVIKEKSKTQEVGYTAFAVYDPEGGELSNPGQDH